MRPGNACPSSLLSRRWLKALTGRGGAADTTSLLNLGEGHLTFMRERASSFLKPTERQTALLTFPRKGIDLNSALLRQPFFPPTA